MAKYEYERVEITFSKNNDIDKELYTFLESNSSIIGKGKYLKLLLKQEYDRQKGLTK